MNTLLKKLTLGAIILFTSIGIANSMQIDKLQDDNALINPSYFTQQMILQKTDGISEKVAQKFRSAVSEDIARTIDKKGTHFVFGDIQHKKKVFYSSLELNDNALMYAIYTTPRDFEKTSLLGLNYSAITDEGLLILSQLQNLNPRIIALGHANITDKGVSYLARNKNLQASLQEIQLNSTLITDDVCQSLAQFSNLRTICLNNSLITDEGISYLADNENLQRNLKQLMLENTLTSENICDSIAKFSNLETITLTSPIVATKLIKCILRNIKVQYPFMNNEQVFYKSSYFIQPNIYLNSSLWEKSLNMMKQLNSPMLNEKYHNIVKHINTILQFFCLPSNHVVPLNDGETLLSKALTLAKCHDEIKQQKIERRILCFFLNQIDKRLELLQEKNDILHKKLENTEQVVNFLIECFITLLNIH